MEYRVNIKEVLEHEVCIDASSKEEALRKVRKAYSDGEIILNWEDMKEADFSID